MEEDMKFRSMRRIKQQLSTEDCEQILKHAYRGFLSVNGDEGYPYTIPVNFVYSNDRIYFHSAIKGHKIDAIQKNPKACFTAINEPVKEENDWWFHVRSVICFGQIQIIEDEETRMEKLRRLGEKYFPKNHNIQGELNQNGPHTLLLEFTIEHMTGKQVKEN